MNNVKKKEWGIAVVIVVVSIGLYFAVRGFISPAEPTYLKRIHDKLANGQTIRCGDGELSAEVVYFDDDGSLVLDSKGEQRGVVFKNTVLMDEVSVGEVQRGEDGTMMVEFTHKPSRNSTHPTTRNSTITARRIRIRIVEQKTMEFKMEDVVVKTEGSETTVYAEETIMTRQLP